MEKSLHKRGDELLNESLFFGIGHARSAVAAWVADYNTERPHSSLGYATPADFARIIAARSNRNGRGSKRRWMKHPWQVTLDHMIEISDDDEQSCKWLKPLAVGSTTEAEMTMQLVRLWGVFTACTVGLAVLWLLSLAPDAFTGGFWLTRKTLVYGTGVLAIGLMSVGVFLAARPVWFETPLGGLDKFYRLHKWLGIGAFAFSVAHWILRMGPSWITTLGWFELPPRPARAAQVQAPTGFDVFRDLREVAAHVGEWTFYLLAILVALALWKRFPYKYFFRTHKLMPAVYLLLVFHTFILTELSYWTKPIGPVLAVLLIAGSVAALISLCQKIGYLRKASGKIAHMRLYDNNVLDVTVRLETAWRGHDAGQFAFVNFDDPEDAHPFTISSAWCEDGLLTFTIKGLGDYTRTLASSLYVGQGVVIEDPTADSTFSVTIGAKSGSAEASASRHSLRA